jgi:hypothetical protein
MGDGRTVGRKGRKEGRKIERKKENCLINSNTRLSAKAPWELTRI